MQNPVNQSNLEANICCLREARENLIYRGIISSGSTSDWKHSGADFISQLLCLVMQNHAQVKTTWKPPVQQETSKTNDENLTNIYWDTFLQAYGRLRTSGGGGGVGVGRALLHSNRSNINKNAHNSHV